MGNGKTKREVLQFVKRLVEKKREKEGLEMVKFNGKGWWHRFMKTVLVDLRPPLKL